MAHSRHAASNPPFLVTGPASEHLRRRVSHTGYADALTTEQAVLRAKAIVRRLIEDSEEVRGEVLDESWNNIDGRPTCSATPSHYMVSLPNYSDGSSLYVLLDNERHCVRIRFDANFAEIKPVSFPTFPCEW